MESAIYVGTVRHRRFAPKRHVFTYPLFMAFLDVDRIAELMQISPFSAQNKFAWASFHDRDHFGDSQLTLRQRIERDALAHGVAAPRGPVFLLTHLRYLGYNFNPVSFFYSYSNENRFDSVLAEVNNTFGETENYWLTGAVEQPAHNSKKYRFQKTFHVSPFMKLGHSYEWTFTPPGDQLIVQSMNYEDGKLLFDSTLKMERREWSRAELHRTLRQYPWMTAKVITAIHWQALRLLVKGVPHVPHPGPERYQTVNVKNLGASWKVR